MAACEMVDLSPPHLPRNHKAGPANHSRTVADEVNIDFPRQGGNALLGEGGNALVFGRLHDKLRFQGGGAQWRGNLPKCHRASSLAVCRVFALEVSAASAPTTRAAIVSGIRKAHGLPKLQPAARSIEVVGV